MAIKTSSEKKTPAKRAALKTVAKAAGLLIGYARVSTQDQNLELQTEALQKAGCKKIFEDRASGSRVERIGLAQVRESLRAGDTLVVGNWIGWVEASSSSSVLSASSRKREFSSEA